MKTVFRVKLTKTLRVMLTKVLKTMKTFVLRVVLLIQKANSLVIAPRANLQLLKERSQKHVIRTNLQTFNKGAGDQSSLIDSDKI